MYKDKEKQREATREAVRRHRQKGITEHQASPEALRAKKYKGITSEGITGQGVTEGVAVTETIKVGKAVPDIIDKLTDPVWRGKLEKICHAFQASHHPDYTEMCWLGDNNLSVVCDYAECTS